MGRRPDAKAVRRADRQRAELLPDAGEGCPKPPMVENNQYMSEIWDMMLGSGSAFEPRDAPFLESLVFNIAIVEDCRRHMLDDDGNVKALVEMETEDGEILVKPNPYQKVMHDAETRALKIAQEMGLTRFCRARLGLTQAMGQSTMLSIAEQIDRAISGGK